ncbi:MAG: UDP-glucose 4-epimerase GalE [Christensenella sp.]
MADKTILVTGGAGYIGSHICVELLENGYDVAVVDNLSNSSEEALKRVEVITGKSVAFYNIDIRHKSALSEVFLQHDIYAVIHMAGLKAVGESVREPLKYFDNNVGGTVALLEVMREHNVRRMIFSSSATVYDLTKGECLTEESPLGNSTSPYGRTKSVIEQLLTDVYRSDNAWSIVMLRYFNPIGAHKSGKIGENPNGEPNNLMPYITQVAVGKRECLSVFGNDYNTPDGTCIRDYIHVMDLADGHIKAVCKLSEGGVCVYNLGTGNPLSVLEVVAAFEHAAGVAISYKFAPRRAGDAPKYYANADKAKKELGFEAKRDIFDMCRDSWNWQKNNPQGYSSAVGTVHVPHR